MKSLAILVFGYFVLAVIAGATDSPLTVLSPAPAPMWSRDLARFVGLDHVSRGGLTALAWGVVLIVVVAFAVVVRAAWSRRIALHAVLIAAGVSLVIAVAAPVLLSHDVFTYAAYGRVHAVYHDNPYLVPLSRFPHDPFVAVTPGQWLHRHSVYGPVFTLLSAALVRVGSVGTTILLFKLVAGVAVAVATGCVAFAATRIRRDRAALATALVGLNPVIVVHTVGGGHVDALVAAALAAALVVTLVGPAYAVTGLLALACLVKPVVVVALFLWLWQLGRSTRVLAAQIGVVLALTCASLVPFLAGWQTFRPLLTFGGVEAWASPSHLVGRVANAFAGADGAHAVEGVFLLVFLVALGHVARRARGAADGWGTSLLLLPLSMPFLLPWYAAWFLPFTGLVGDATLVAAGVVVSIVLALTLIPADPFHRLTSPAVMDGVHYGAASILLIVFVVITMRILEIEPKLRSARARRHGTALLGS